MRAAVTPQRRHGKQRVAQLLEAGASVIAERGYEAATMAEIAARAASPIGSLYRFFPSKDQLAEALIRRYMAQIDEEFAALATRARLGSSGDIADAILDFTVRRRAETKVIVALLEARSEWPSRRQQFRQNILAHIAQTVTLLAPALPPKIARDIAVILFHNMRLMKALKFNQDVPSTPGAIEELRRMNHLYVADRLAAFRREA